MRPPYASRIRAAREAAHLPIEAIANRRGIETSWYEDLEHDDDEVMMTLSLAQVALLCDSLGLRPGQLLADSPAARPNQGSVSFDQLAERIGARIAMSHQSVAAFEQEVGWQVGPGLEDPEHFWWLLNGDGLHDVCSAVGLEWLDALPRSTPAAHIPLRPA